MKVAMITNIPSPYRAPVYDRLADALGDGFMVFYSARLEPNRRWILSDLRHRHTYLKPRFLRYGAEGFMHVNFDIWPELFRFKPDVVMLTGYSPTSQLAFLWAKLTRTRVVLYNEVWKLMERALSPRRRMVWKLMNRGSHAFVGASNKAKELYLEFGASPGRVFVAPMSVANERFRPMSTVTKNYDLMFSGQFIERKCPGFFVEVAKAVAARRSIRPLLLGDGPLREQTLDDLKHAGIPFTWPGFVQQNDLPGYFRASKVFLFPTQADTWGIVANEACAAGLPVITTPVAGAAGELVLDGHNGFVLDLDVETWTEHILMLLEQDDRYRSMSRNAIDRVQEFTYDRAAEGFLNACNAAASM
jgi:glycosyltransferase involved in cell wall biosynthesis